jgi:hypothetical protein
LHDTSGSVVRKKKKKKSEPEHPLARKHEISYQWYKNKEQKKQLLLLVIVFLDGVCGDGALGEYLGGEDGLHPPHVVRPHHQLHAQGLQVITQRGNKGEMLGLIIVDPNPVDS